MKMRTWLLAGAALFTTAAHAQDCEFQKPEYTAVMKELGTPPIIRPVKPGEGNTVVAVVWIYPEAAHGKDIAVILIEGEVKALLVDGQVAA